MNSEFVDAVNEYVGRFLGQIRQVQEEPTGERRERGLKLTRAGPPPPPQGGDILSEPDLLWAEDLPWDDTRIKAAKERLVREQGNRVVVDSFWKSKYEREGSKYWHQFYKRNKDHFYKDRHYLHIVFPELAPPPSTIDKGASFEGKPLRLLEVGCGVGNAVLPLLELNPNLEVYCFDFARSAIEILCQHPLALQPNPRLFPSVTCAVKDELPIADGSIDLVLCFFVLSAIPPSVQGLVIRKLARALKVGGKLLIRDYGRYDEAQLRFSRNNRLADNHYVRSDGTLSYYFDLDDLDSLCSQGNIKNQALGPESANSKSAELTGLQKEEAEYILRQYANRGKKEARHRVWVHGKYVKR